MTVILVNSMTLCEATDHPNNLKSSEKHLEEAIII